MMWNFRSVIFCMIPRLPGGLLLSLDSADVANLVSDLNKIGVSAACIGEFVDGSSGTIEVLCDE